MAVSYVMGVLKKNIQRKTMTILVLKPMILGYFRGSPISRNHHKDMIDVFVRFIELHVFKIVQEFHQATFPNNFEPLNYRA
jgi:hypothetical protein